MRSPPAALDALPLVTLYLTERCNSRCRTCDYWRQGRVDLTAAAVAELLPSLAALRTQVALISGGEPLVHPDWTAIAEMLRAAGLKLWLLTAGLALGKFAQRAAALCESITVSMDGTNRETYRTIRGLDAFDSVCAGIRAAIAAGATVSIRVTLQRTNYRELSEFVALAHRLGVAQVSFVAVDVANPHAFGRGDGFTAEAALEAQDLDALDELITDLVRDYGAEFESTFIAESPHKLRRIHQYFSAVRGLGPYPPVRCNAPEFSAVIAADGRVQPCFFIPGPAEAVAASNLGRALNGPAMMALRAAIRAGERPECTGCVCSMWRDPESRVSAPFLLASRPT